MFWNKQRETAASRSSVTDDWRSLLPAEKKCLFDQIVRHWEDAYAIFSVALDDAMSLRLEGKIGRACQCAEIAAGAIGNLTAPLEGACRTLDRIGRHLASPPSIAPLNPGFFRGEAARQNAHWNQLMHTVLFGGRSRFLHKLRVLEIIVADSAEDFCRVCDDLVSSHHREASWLRLDELHYDVNTCLREIVVVLKSFLLAMPSASLADFQTDLNASVIPPPARQSPRPSLDSAILGRRAGHFRRE
ncbi:MAG TPA: hypothetical protein VGR93_04060 [Candidatus Acidoferrales bacterium]|nr:hypothetical protein [Candidatus Acidoferrales bacterium]